MKFKNYLMESTTGSLIGKTINGRKITEKTKTEHWEGDFDCTDNRLTSLVGAPTVVRGCFGCSENQLTSLVGAPTSVRSSFKCQNNQLTSLVGAPTSVGGDFQCYQNQLTSLVGAPAVVRGNFNCYSNQLTTLVGAPALENGGFGCAYNQLTSLVGAPAVVTVNFDCAHNQLTSLRGIHKEIKQIKSYNGNGIFNCPGNPIKEAVLGLLLIKGLMEVMGLPCDDIINKYLPNNRGMEGVSRCQDELEEAGYGDFAEL